MEVGVGPMVIVFVSPELCSERGLVITWRVSVRPCVRPSVRMTVRADVRPCGGPSVRMSVRADLLVSNILAKPYEL